MVTDSELIRSLEDLMNQGMSSIHIGKAGQGGYYVTADDWQRHVHLQSRSLSFRDALSTIITPTNEEDLLG